MGNLKRSDLNLCSRRLPCISGTTGAAHVSLLSLSCAPSQRTPLRPATVPPLWAASLHCVWVSAPSADQCDCPQYVGYSAGTKWNLELQQRCFPAKIGSSVVILALLQISRTTLGVIEILLLKKIFYSFTKVLIYFWCVSKYVGSLSIST